MLVNPTTSELASIPLCIVLFLKWNHKKCPSIGPQNKKKKLKAKRVCVDPLSHYALLTDVSGKMNSIASLCLGRMGDFNPFVSTGMVFGDEVCQESRKFRIRQIRLWKKIERLFVSKNITSSDWVKIGPWLIDCVCFLIDKYYYFLSIFYRKIFYDFIQFFTMVLNKNWSFS